MGIKTDIIISSLAGRTGGVLTRAEMLQAGLASSTVADRVRRGYLVAVGAGVYELPELESPLTPLFRAVKAVDGAVLSHWTAGRVLGFAVGPVSSEVIHVTTRRGPRTEVPGVVVHHSRRIDDDEVTEVQYGLWATSPARTLLDLAGTNMGDRRLQHLVEGQILSRAPSAEQLRHYLDARPRHGVRGAARLRRIVDDLFGHRAIPESKLEAELVRLLDRSGLGRFVAQYRPPWYEGRRGIVDLADPDHRLIIEADGRRWHQQGQAMDDDRMRDRMAAAHGWAVVRVTWADVVERPSATTDQLAAVLAARAA